MKPYSLIELLEDRIAPATIVNPYTVTYKDFESGGGGGDTIVVKLSKPLFTSPAAAANILQFTDSTGASQNSLTAFTGNASAQHLHVINFEGVPTAQNVNISVSVLSHVGLGSGTVNVDAITAALFSNNQVTENIDLGHIYIQGDLGSISAGDNFSTPAIKSLKVLSMSSTALSQVLGPITSLDIQGNCAASFNMIGYQFGSIQNLKIGGDLTGVIEFTGHIGTASIGSITGGSSSNSGEIIGTTLGSQPAYISSLHVLGNVTGGSGQNSGSIVAQSFITKVTVDGSVIGGSGQNSGDISSRLGTIDIAGNVTGGTGVQSGALLSQNFVGAKLSAGHISIGGNLVGGTAGTPSSGSAVGQSGVIEAKSASSVFIGGSLTGGTAVTSADSQTGKVTPVASQSAQTSGAVLIDGALGSLYIGRGIAGGTGLGSGEVSIGGALASGTIKGDLVGGNAALSSDLVDSGYLLAGHIGTLRVEGNVTSGSNTGGGSVANAGAIRSSGEIGILTVTGAVTGTAANPVFITAATGTASKTTAAQDLAIRSIDIQGNSAYLDILAGYSPPTEASASGPALGTAADGSVHIQSVAFGGTIMGTNVVAGANPTPSNGYFGDSGNSAIALPVGKIVSEIAKITVTGQIIDTPVATDKFGFVAQGLGTVSVNGHTVATNSLIPGTPAAIPADGITAAANSDTYLLKLP